MTGLGARPSIGATLVAFLLVGCTASPNQTPGASATAAAAATVAPTSTPVSPPPTPSGSQVACPSPLATELASTDELADPSCYGTTELTVDGWLAEQTVFVSIPETAPSWTMSIAGLFPGRQAVRDWIFDFLMVGPVSAVSVVTPPETGIDVSGIGRWARLHGHFNDPTASACTVVTSTDEEGPGVLPECERLFVVSGLEEIDRPTPTCPTESPLDLTVFLDADAACFIGLDVRIRGWEDVGEGFGGAAPTYPITLDPSLQLAAAQLTSRRWEGDGEIDSIFPWTIAGSGVRFARSDVRVVVTGGYGHDVSERCLPGPFPAWTWAPPDSWAQHRCEHLFVITGVRDRD
jgi:hypothetical protein